MVWTELTEAIAAALQSAGIHSPERIARLELAIPRDPSHGDWTTNLALMLAKDLGLNPRELAATLARELAANRGHAGPGALFAPPVVAGPGFLNFRYADAFVESLPARMVHEGAAFGRSNGGAADTVLVEYVSANPTGPLNVVSARAAAVGASLVRLLDATGHRAEGEFYVNDAGNQVDLLGASVAARFAETKGLDRAMPPEGYQGGYIREVAAGLDAGEAAVALAREDGTDWFRTQALERMLESQRRDLDAYGATFARWFRESTLHASGAVADTLAALESRGVTYRATRPESGYERPEDARHAADGEQPAVWLRASAFGDSQDRVIVRGNGTPTYLLPDIAYHRDKRSRFRHAIDLWGPDHHAYVRTMQAALAALGLESDALQVLIVQQVNLVSGGQPVKMSKRAGEFITLRELMDDVGADCAKFFFLMRSTSAHLDFDLDLARRQNDENPAYYVQYAHARIASILRYAAERGITPDASTPARFEALEERALIRKLAAFPEVVRGAAFAREPHRIPTYLMETAAEFHRFYHACRVVSDDAARTRDRLLLCDAARAVIRNGLTLMGIGAPERMDRAGGEDTA